MTTVHCTVGNCRHWGEGNECHAGEILITGFPIAPRQADVDRHGAGTEDHEKTPVDRSDGTFCFTFERGAEAREREQVPPASARRS